MSLYWKGNKLIAVMTFPDRKRKSLCIGEGNRMERVATFKSDDAADRFEELFVEYLGDRLREESDD